jgi:hypothetical protein
MPMVLPLVAGGGLDWQLNTGCAVLSDALVPELGEQKRTPGALTAHRDFRSIGILGVFRPPPLHVRLVSVDTRRN